MTVKQIEQLLKDYHWMINSVKIMREGLNDVGGNFTAQYGLEAAMPKAAGGHSDPIYQEFSRREKRWKKISDYEQKIKMVQDKIHLITVDREIERFTFNIDIGNKMISLFLYSTCSYLIASLLNQIYFHP